MRTQGGETVQVIQVMVGSQQVALHVNRARLNLFALVEAPDVRPTIGSSPGKDYLDEYMEPGVEPAA